MHAKLFFLDTNVLVYAYTSQSDAKSEVANALITSGEAMISAQVLNAFCNTIRRKFPDLYPQLARAVDELVATLPVAPLTFMPDGACTPKCESYLTLTLATTRSAVHLSQRDGWSFYDALIVAAALDAGCTVLLSEDMQHNMMVETLRIQNPFLLT